jgi:phosphonoacetate hydrolase
MKYASATQKREQGVPLEVNGRSLQWPKRPTVVICLDGGDPAYLEAARAAGTIPALDRMMREGFSATAAAVMPTFTNPNNVSIVCGAPPSVHGVSGNYYLERDSGREIMMLDASPLRAPTILSVFSQAGAGVIAITAKDKLRKALGKDLDGIAFSAEKADAPRRSTASRTSSRSSDEGFPINIRRSCPCSFWTRACGSWP